jgi:hypothetical protein
MAAVVGYVAPGEEEAGQALAMAAPEALAKAAMLTIAMAAVTRAEVVAGSRRGSEQCLRCFVGPSRRAPAAGTAYPHVR